MQDLDAQQHKLHCIKCSMVPNNWHIFITRSLVRGSLWDTCTHETRVLYYNICTKCPGIPLHFDIEFHRTLFSNIKTGYFPDWWAASSFSRAIMKKISHKILNWIILLSAVLRCWGVKYIFHCVRDKQAGWCRAVQLGKCVLPRLFLSLQSIWVDFKLGLECLILRANLQSLNH